MCDNRVWATSFLAMFVFKMAVKMILSIEFLHTHITNVLDQLRMQQCVSIQMIFSFESFYTMTTLIFSDLGMDHTVFI